MTFLIFNGAGKAQGRNRSVKKEEKQVVEPVILDPANPVIPISTEETSTIEPANRDTAIEGNTYDQSDQRWWHGAKIYFAVIGRPCNQTL